MRVPLCDHTFLYRKFKPEFDCAIARVLKGGELDWGRETPAFEKKFANWQGVRHAVGTNSGTVALKIALAELGIGPGDEVITAPNGDIGSTSAIHHAGAKAIWVDVEADTGNLDPQAVEDALTSRTAAVLAMDLRGHPADIPALSKMAAQHGLVLVEDACLALGASVGGRSVGQWAGVTCFSFSPSKCLGSFGSGRAALADNEALARVMRRHAGCGQDRQRHYQRGLAPPRLDHRSEG